jgi:hypothetical protein
MQIIRSLGDADAVTDATELRQLITDTFARVADCPEILGYVLVVEPGDSIAIIDAILRFSILAGRHEFIVEHAGYFELVYVLGQDGTGIEVLVSKVIVALPELLAMCIEHALPPEPMP